MPGKKGKDENCINKKMWGDNTPWKTEAQWWGYVRGCLRKAWMRHPVKINKIKNTRKRIPNPNPKGRVKEVWGGMCEECNSLFVQSQLEVDHIIPAGQLSSVEDIKPFFTRLVFVTEDDLRVVCKECHKAISLADRNGISVEEAKATRKAIYLIKEKKDRKFLEDRGITPGSNQKTRRSQIIDYLSGGKETCSETEI